MTFEDWWRVNDCCGLDREDAETIWDAGFRAALSQVKQATADTNTEVRVVLVNDPA